MRPRGRGESALVVFPCGVTDPAPMPCYVGRELSDVCEQLLTVTRLYRDSTGPGLLTSSLARARACVCVGLVDTLGLFAESQGDLGASKASDI